MKKIKCKVCEYEFDAIRSNHYIARGEGKSGLAAIGGGDEIKIYDVFDCPYVDVKQWLKKEKEFMSRL